MVIKRQCSFCADEIEPGTGTMFVKRDGTVFHFCSSSCRKQQLYLGRVGHRLKWTRAHALKRAADQRSVASGAAPKGEAGPAKPGSKAKPARSKAKTPGPPLEEKPAKPVEVPKPAAEKSAPEESAAPAKKPRARKPKGEASSAEAKP
jgi:large subunit ribosomal protein L24e